MRFGFGVAITQPRNRSAASGGGGQQFIAIAHDASPYVSAYPWDSVDGFGAKLADPSTLPPGAGRRVQFTPSGDALALGHLNGAGLSMYAWSADGFGVKYADGSVTSPGGTNGVAVSSLGGAVAILHSNSPFVSVYAWDAASGLGARFSNPATLPGIHLAATFSSSGHLFAVGFHVYPWSDLSGFGTKYANPAILPSGFNQDVDFSPNGDAIAIGHRDSPYLSVYPWSDISGFGARYSNPAVGISGNGVFGLSFSPSGDFLAISNTSPGSIGTFPFNLASGIGTRRSDPNNTLSGGSSNLEFSPDGAALMWADGGYSWSDASGLGPVAYVTPAIAPARTRRGVAFTSI
jgi:hypothetical protein